MNSARMRRSHAVRIVASTTIGVRVIPEATRGGGCHAQQMDVAVRRSTRIAAKVAAYGTGAVVVAAGVLGAVLDARFHAIGRDDPRGLAGAGWVFAAAIVSSAVVGTALLFRRPRHPVGWLFAAVSVAVAVAGATQSYGEYGLLARPGSLPGASGAAAVASVAFVLWLVILGLICSLTPDGHYLSRRWRMASRIMVGAGMVWFVAHLFESGPLEAP